jgi:hypothetical protein
VNAKPKGDNSQYYFKTVAQIFSLAGAKSFGAGFKIYLPYQRREAK